MNRGPLLLALLLILTAEIFGQVTTASSDDLSRWKERIEHGSVEDKRGALFEIRNRRSADASAIAIAALRDADEMVRATAASSVVFLPSADAARALMPLLNDSSEFVRREAAFALGEVGDTSATGALTKTLRTDKISEVRTAAAAALGKVGDTSAVSELISILKTRPRDEDEFLRRSAARSIGQIVQIIRTGRRPVVTPQNFLPDKFKDRGPADASNESKTFSAASDVLLDVLRRRTESDDTRREAAFALGAIGDPKAVPDLESTVASPDPYLAEIAREALLKIRSQQN